MPSGFSGRKTVPLLLNSYIARPSGIAFGLHSDGPFVCEICRKPLPSGRMLQTS